MRVSYHIGHDLEKRKTLSETGKKERQTRSVGFLNSGTTTGEGRELSNMTEKKATHTVCRGNNMAGK